ncbi:MAG: enoyl-CoA hydratase/isomerase family protein [Candidatus Eisenbacteria bacterium]|uniref:Enoyl-CoA hydratase/isomerase family protein n=1 Tax=Eiseniibacteriota bacterium TaxID=2212470 RepID=A0A849SGC3_UNCEI|nr:enoyl-CoA hydratase/isomerase family protein [Candidatus Eisenbacteria bacterium]
MSLVEVERKGPVARVWFNRPELHNALSPEVGAELAKLVHDLEHDDEVRVVVLGGRGPSFCAGADIGAMKASADASFDQNLAEAEKLAGTFAALADFPKPVVGRVHGGVYGGGVGFVCACDIVVASDDAKFGLTEVRLGILPGIISPYVIRRLGDRIARELMLTGERFDAATALRLGLVNYLVPLAELDARVDERVGELLKGGPGAQKRIKMLLELWADSSWEEYRAALPRTLAEVRSGAEAKDGLAAFFEKRKPRWMGQE